MNSIVNTKDTSGIAIMRVARDVLGLFKLRIGFMIMITALVGMAITPGPALGLAKVLILALAVLVSAGAAGAFNQYYEHQTDRLMARTRGRAFVTGALPHTPAWLVLIALLLAVSVGAAALLLNWLSAGFVFLGAFFYGVVYTVWLKRRSWLNIVVGGLSGSFAVLAGWRCSGRPGNRPAPVDTRSGVVPVDATALLESRHRQSSRVCSRRGADVASGSWHAARGAYCAVEYRGTCLDFAAAGIFRCRSGLLCGRLYRRGLLCTQGVATVRSAFA